MAESGFEQKSFAFGSAKAEVERSLSGQPGKKETVRETVRKLVRDWL